LVIVAPSGALEVPMELWQRYAAHQDGILSNSPFDLGSEFENNIKIVPQIVFSDPNWGKQGGVIQTLTEMYNCVIQIMQYFDRFLGLG
jgi:hypothetical protein